MAKTKPGAAKASAGNGLKTFSIHGSNDASRTAMAAVNTELASHASFTSPASADAAGVDPETAARRFLRQALESPAVPQFTAPAADDTPSEFKSLGTETIPLTG